MSAHFDPSKASWRKSSYSGGDGGDCVEAADGVSGVLPLRDSKIPDGPVVTFGHGCWSTFVTALRNDTLSA